MMPDNYNIYIKYDSDQAAHEAENIRVGELIGWVINDVEKIKSTLGDYDTEDLKNMANVIEEATEQLEDLIGKLEGER